MAGLQGIDSDFTDLTQGNTPLANDRYSSGLTPITGGSYQGSQGNIPVSYMQPTSKDLTSQETTPGQDIQSKVQGVQKPDIGKMLLLGLLGGPNAVNQYYSRTMQKQVEPIIQDISLQYRQALNAGDFNSAQKIVSQLGPLTPYSPNAGKLLESFTDIINKRQDNVQQNKAFIGDLIKRGALKEGSPGYTDFTNPATLLQDPSIVIRKYDLYKQSGQVMGGMYTITDPFTGEIKSQQVTPQQSVVENMPKPIVNALIKNGLDPYVYAELSTKVRSGNATPREMNEYKLYQNSIQGQAATNVETEQFPISEQIKTGATPQQRTAITGGKPLQDNIPQGNKASVTPYSPNQQELAQQKFILNTQDAVANGVINQDQANILYQKRGIPIPGSTNVNPASQLRQQQTEQEVQEASGRAKAQYEAEYAKQPQGQLVGYKVDKDGHLVAGPSGMSHEWYNQNGWHTETFPDAQRKGLTDFPKFQAMYEHVSDELQHNPVFKDPSAWKEYAGVMKDYFQRGIEIPFTNLRVGGMAVGSANKQNVNAALATVAQMVELISNPSGQQNEAIGSLKNYITSPNAKPEGIMAALSAVHDIALAGVKGSVGVTKGAVEESNPRSKSQVQGTDIKEKYQTPSNIKESESKKTGLDRSKFKAVTP